MLPTQKTPPVIDPARKTILLYGPSKIGKSTWASKAEDALFLATEPGLSSLEVYQLTIRSWQDLLSACKEIEEGKHPFKSIVIDTIDNAYRFVQESVCEKNKVEYFNDGSLAYGKGRSIIDNEFYRVLRKLGQLGIGLILISHSQEKEYEDSYGTTRQRVVPTLPEKAGALVLGLVDAILFADVESEEVEGKRTWRRVIRTKPTARYQAGVRGGDTLADSYLMSDYSGFMRDFEAALRNGNGAQLRTPAKPAPVTTVPQQAKK